ncbi:hypothetical protein, variant 1 [Aphanomyces astaci]|uniref:Palmitoyltransferase n=1 Tax=Aphanomyces astaci TaxID=112090 RepID=W4G403_APHAT|nr:hypothetical protein, variant 1 [Aphanomyces astaci]ETV74442.1 hypothetical protein, variant 1 [Aphanomyces astaci]|eukprot:XP_009836101.1 hypothetical protein, variant 1 [Aphanomyces astaci]
MQSPDEFLAFVQAEAPRLHPSTFRHASSPSLDADGKPRLRRGTSDPPPPTELPSSNEVDMTMELLHMTLLDNPTWANVSDRNQCSLLHWVAQRGAPPLLQLLLDHGASVDTPDDNGLWPVHWAAAANNLPVLRTLLQAHRELLNAPDSFKQRTPLILAVQHGHLATVLYLLRQGADASRVDQSGDTVVHWSAYKGLLETLRVCYAYADALGVDTLLFHVPDGFGQTPLHLAAVRGHAEIVAFLVDEVNVAMEGEDDKGRTPLALARSKGHGAAAAVLQTRLYRRRSVLRLIRHALRSRFPRLVRRLPIVFQATNLLVVPCWYGGVFSRYDGLATAMTWHSVLLAVTWFFFGCAAWLDPGTVAHDRKYVEEYTTTMQRCLLQEYEGDDASNLARNQGEQPLDERLRRFCHTCHVAQPRRSKHCNVCHRCVLLFDHHCPFLGTCVGRNNYTFFLAFTICMSIAALSLAWMWYTTWMHMDPEATLWCVLAASYYTLVGLCAAGLFIFHLVLAAKNRTTHEFRAAGCTFNETDDLHRESGSWRQNYLGRLCVSVYHYVDMIKTQRPQHRKHVKVEIDHRRDYV